MLPRSYDPLLVAMSFAVALLGSYAALALVPRLAHDGRLRLGWLLAAAIAQGTGIWTMHFTGMLALKLPVAISYEATLVVISYIVAVAGCALAFWLTHRRRLSSTTLVFGAFAIGAGISGLHYIGMAAMRMDARTHYRSLLVIASIIVAVVFGFLSLSLCRSHRVDDSRRTRWEQLPGAFLMALAIVGQHYTGMAAAVFTYDPNMRRAGQLVLPSSELPEWVLSAALLILTGALVGANVDRRLHAHAIISQRLLDAQENERRRISRLLHQDLGQLLTAIRINLQRLAPSLQDIDVIDDTMALAEEALARVRDISVELRPAVLDDIGLSAAVAWFALRWEERSGYALTIEDQLGPARLPEAVETASFRITQQALTNIARHARASNVRIRMRQRKGVFELTVSDDGTGFDVRAARSRAEAGESLGVLDMAELAALAGGHLTITSEPGRGSTIRARFFLPV